MMEFSLINHCPYLLTLPLTLRKTCWAVKVAMNWVNVSCDLGMIQDAFWQTPGSCIKSCAKEWANTLIGYAGTIVSEDLCFPFKFYFYKHLNNHLLCPTRAIISFENAGMHIKHCEISLIFWILPPLIRFMYLLYINVHHLCWLTNMLQYPDVWDNLLLSIESTLALPSLLGLEYLLPHAELLQGLTRNNMSIPLFYIIADLSHKERFSVLLVPHQTL